MFLSVCIGELGLLIYFYVLYFGDTNIIHLLHKINWNFYLFLFSETDHTILIRSHTKQGICLSLAWCLCGKLTQQWFLRGIWLLMFAQRQCGELAGSMETLVPAAHGWNLGSITHWLCALRHFADPAMPPFLHQRREMVNGNNENTGLIRLLRRLKELRHECL